MFFCISRIFPHDNILNISYSWKNMFNLNLFTSFIPIHMLFLRYPYFYLAVLQFDTLKNSFFPVADARTFFFLSYWTLFLSIFRLGLFYTINNSTRYEGSLFNCIPNFVDHEIQWIFVFVFFSKVKKLTDKTWWYIYIGVFS